MVSRGIRLDRFQDEDVPDLDGAAEVMRKT